MNRNTAGMKRAFGFRPLIQKYLQLRQVCYEYNSINVSTAQVM
jgi:hypothetical protein